MTTQNNLDLVWALNAGLGVEDPGDTKYENGWTVEIPTHEHFNFVLQNNSKNILALAEKGSHLWQTEISYEPGARVRGNGKYYTCITNSTGNNPDLDTLHNYWMAGMLIGDEVLSNAIHSRGVHIKNVNERSGEVIWDGSDLTLDNQSPVLQLTSSSAVAKNWLVSNISGFLTAIDIGTTTNPDGRSLALSETDSHKIYHEGNKPTQSEVSGTIPDSFSNDNTYGRRNGVWQVVPHIAAAAAVINGGTENFQFITSLGLRESNYLSGTDRASSVEINTGTSTTKWISPSDLRASNYLDHNNLANAGDINTGNGQYTYVTPLQLFLSDYMRESQVDAKVDTKDRLNWLSSAALVYQYSAGSGGQGTYHTVNLNTTTYPGIKFANIRIFMDTTGDEHIYVMPDGMFIADAMPHLVKGVVGVLYDYITVQVPVDANGDFRVYWTQFDTTGVQCWLESYTT